MTFATSEVEKALVDKGFDQKKSEEPYLLRTMLRWKRNVIRTHISHGGKSKALNKNLISKMAGQRLLCNRCFNKFVRNEMSKDDYLEHLWKLQNVIGRTLLSAPGGKPLPASTSACDDCVTKSRQARGWQ